MKQKKKPSVQTHHIRYANDPLGEWKVPMYRGEHLVIGLLNRHTVNVSVGFVTALQDWLQRNVAKAVAL